MSMVKKILLALACLTFMTLGARASATNVYIAQNAAGAGNGADCADAKPVSFFNTSGNWGSGSAQIGPGTTVHLCGTFTGGAGSTMLTVQGSGASGSPITILFENGAVLQAPYWGSNPFSGGPGAILCSGKSYITIDGGTNGVIQNTANGSASLGYSTQTTSTGIFATQCPNFTVQGSLKVTNIFVHAENDTNGGNTAGIWVENSDNVSITGATVTEASVPVNVGYEPPFSITKGTLAHLTIDHGCHLLVVGDGNSNGSASGMSIHDNVIGPHTQDWNASDQSCHQDGLFLQATNSGSTISNFQIYNNWISSDMCSDRSAPGLNCTAPVFYSGSIVSTQFFNNIVQYTASTGGYEALIRLAGSQQTSDSFYNNTFDENNSSANQSCDCAVFKSTETTGQTQSGFQVLNNIFLNIASKVFLNEDGTLQGKYTAINDNVYYNVSQYGVDFSDNQQYSTFSQWKGLGFDAGGSTANPNLTGNYVPQSTSAGITLGTNLTGLGLSALDTDKNGNPRPTSGAWTAGVYQAGSTSAPAPPAGLTAIVQ